MRRYRGVDGQVGCLGKVAETEAFWEGYRWKIADYKGKTLSELDEICDLEEFIGWVFFYETQLDSTRNLQFMLAQFMAGFAKKGTSPMEFLMIDKEIRKAANQSTDGLVPISMLPPEIAEGFQKAIQGVEEKDNGDY